ENSASGLPLLAFSVSSARRALASRGTPGAVGRGGHRGPPGNRLLCPHAKAAGESSHARPRNLLSRPAPGAPGRDSFSRASSSFRHLAASPSLPLASSSCTRRSQAGRSSGAAAGRRSPLLPRRGVEADEGPRLLVRQPQDQVVVAGVVGQRALLVLRRRAHARGGLAGELLRLVLLALPEQAHGAVERRRAAGEPLRRAELQGLRRLGEQAAAVLGHA